MVLVFILFLCFFSSWALNSTNGKLTSLSECTKGRITFYEDYTGNAACSYGSVPTVVTDGYFFRAALNTAFYDGSNQCGICYELVGADSAIRIIVSDECPVSTNQICDGEMLHFDLAMNAFPYLADLDVGVVNVTFRMVACDHTGNVKINSLKGNNENYFAFVITNHVIGVEKVEISYDNGKNYKKIDRTDYNVFIVENESGIELPFLLRITSIAGDSYVTKITEVKKEYVTETDFQFNIPSNTFFDVQTLKTIEKPSTTETCCSQQNDIQYVYNDSLKGVWSMSSYDTVIISEKSNQAHSGNSYIKAEMNNLGSIQIDSMITFSAKYYSSLSFYIESSKDGAKLEVKKLSEKKDITGKTIEIPTKNEWTEVVVSLKELGITDDEERIMGVEFTNMDSKTTFRIDDIAWKRSDVSTAFCADGQQLVLVDNSYENLSIMTQKLELLMIIMCIVFMFA
ncbi:Expansin-B5 [Entamoeba marina]